jgi:hypothetical protein
MRGDGQNQLKILAPHPATETYQLIPLLATLISLDSPFKYSSFSASLNFIDRTVQVFVVKLCTSAEYARRKSAYSLIRGTKL